MTVSAIQTGLPVILNLQGTGLNGGQVFVGVAGQDPQSVPQPVYWDAAGLISATQPVPTIGGYISRSGTPATLYVGADYSMRVLARDNTLVFYSAYAGTASTTSAALSANPADLIVSRQGGGTVNGEVHLVFPIVRPLTFPIDFAGSLGSVRGFPPTATYVVTISKNGLPVGTATFATTGVVTFSSSGLPVTFALNDIFVAQGGPADSTLADWGFTLKGNRA